MSYRDTIADLLRHQTWADAAAWTAVMASPSAMTDAAIQDRLVHIHLVQHVYLQGWQARAFDPTIPPFADATSRMRWGYEYHRAVTPFIEALDADRLDQAFPLPWTEIVEQSLGRPPGPVKVVETLMQVPLHSTYHRGQIATRMRELGGEPAATDFILWVFLGKPAASWPAFQAPRGA
jgi:uncharacterized damage-inducible protein DinB